MPDATFDNIDQLLGPQGGVPQSGPVQDTIWSSAKDAGAKVLNAIGYGAQQGWGSEPLGLSPETEAALRQAGIFNDYQNGHTSLMKSFNEAVIRPAATAAEAFGRSITGALGGAGGALMGTAEVLDPNQSFSSGEGFHGSLAQRAGQALAPIAGSTGEFLQSDLAAGLLGSEFGPDVALGRISAGPREAVAGERVLDANRARAVGAVGEGEAGFYDATPQTPETLQARAAAAQEAGIEPVPPSPPVDIHELARRVDPDTFEQYDALAAERDAARAEVQRLSDERLSLPEVQDAQGRIDTILSKVNGVESRLTNAAAQRLKTAQADLDRLLTTDTEDMAAARQKLLAADYGMRDLSPQVSEAYRQAQDMMPGPLPEKAPEATQGATPAQEDGAVAPGEPHVGPVPAGALASPEAQIAGGVPKVLGEETLGEPTRPKPDGAAPEQASGETAEGAARPRNAGGMKPIEGTGEIKTRGLSEGVEAKAIEEGLISTFGDLPEYHAVSMAEQAQAAAKLISVDYERAKAVAMGERQAPKGLLPESVFVAVEKHALATGDVDTLLQLGTRSKLSTAATTMGQRIRALGERDKASPVGAIQEVQAAREAALKAKNIDIEAEKAKIAAEVKTEMKKAATVRHDKWEDFLTTIRCVV